MIPELLLREWPGHEADLSLQSRIEVKIVWGCTSTPQTEYLFLFIPCKPTLFPSLTPSTSAFGAFLLNSTICYWFSCSFDSVLLYKRTIFVFPAYLTILPWRRRKHVSQKHWCLFTKPQTFSCEKKELLMHCCSHYLPLHNNLLWLESLPADQSILSTCCTV